MNIRRLRPGAFVELECKHFVSEGLGLSYFTDEAMKEKFKPHVFFIWGVLPGERFVARLAKVKSKNAHGVLARIEELPAEYAGDYAHAGWALRNLAAKRVAPPCENFLRCGGCKMQHMSYADSLKYKEEWLQNQLRQHKIEVPPILCDVTPQNELTHYRNHVQVHINKFGVYGFYEPISYRTRAFPEHGCLIFDEKSLRASFPKFPVEVRTARIRRNTDGKAVFTVINSKAEAATDMRYTIAWPEGSATEIEFPVTQFFQVNLRTLPRWLGIMADYLAPYAAAVGASANLRLLELFSGFGFISRMLAQRFGLDILAADLLKREEVLRVILKSADGAILTPDFAHNYHRVDLFLSEKISQEFMNAVRRHRPEVLLVNPPRAGLTPETWARLRADALADFKGPIIYSSCNAATMARDMGYLAAEGYRVRDIRLFDFFPWTHHFETVALLTRAS